MRIVVFGADGGVGRRAIDAVGTAGHGAVALARSSHVRSGGSGSARRVRLDARDGVGARRLVAAAMVQVAVSRAFEHPAPFLIATRAGDRTGVEA